MWRFYVLTFNRDSKNRRFQKSTLNSERYGLMNVEDVVESLYVIMSSLIIIPYVSFHFQKTFKVFNLNLTSSLLSTTLKF